MTNRLVFDRFRKAAVRKARFAACVALGALGLALSASAQKPVFATFDAPGAGAGPGQGTFVIMLNGAGEILGSYRDATGSSHGYVRDRAGKFTTIEFPGASDTIALGLNEEGIAAGYYVASGVAHGFLRSRDGRITTFDIPGAGTGKNQGTFARNINASGAILGDYTDGAGVTHGFFGRPGDFVFFEAPGAVSTFVASGQGMNPSGDGVGGYPDYANVNHGYVRYAEGTLVRIDPLGTASTYISSINPEGTISGMFMDNSQTFHGLVRAAYGRITPFDAPGAGSGSYRGTFTSNINPSGEIVGIYVDDQNVLHGYVRTADGDITTIDAPGAGTGARQGTLAPINDASGRIAGYYIDSNGVAHGYLRTP